MFLTFWSMFFTIPPKACTHVYKCIHRLSHTHTQTQTGREMKIVHFFPIRKKWAGILQQLHTYNQITRASKSRTFVLQRDDNHVILKAPWTLLYLFFFVHGDTFYRRFSKGLSVILRLNEFNGKRGEWWSEYLDRLMTLPEHTS